MKEIDLEFTKILYQTEFVDVDLSKKIYDDIYTMMSSDSKKFITDDNNVRISKLSRKTMVFVDEEVMNDAIIPKIWGDGVKILPFNDDIKRVKDEISKITGYRFNICLANWYSDGNDCINWHSDKEEKGSTSCIASISLGQERIFEFRKIKDKEIVYTQLLEDRSLLIMQDGCQENYHHRLPQMKNCKSPRLNLTFRLFDYDRYKN